jgi:hypothetical protein
MDVLASRRLRITSEGANSTMPLSIWFTYHAITFAVADDISGSGGGTVNIDVFNSLDDTLIASTSRSGDGAYSVTVYDDTNAHYAVAREDSTHMGRSDDGTPA